MFQRVQQMSRQMCFGQFNWYFWHRMSDAAAARDFSVNCLIMRMERESPLRSQSGSRGWKAKEFYEFFLKTRGKRKRVFTATKLGKYHLPSIKYSRNPERRENKWSSHMSEIYCRKLRVSLFLLIAPLHAPSMRHDTNETSQSDKCRAVIYVNRWTPGRNFSLFFMSNAWKARWEESSSFLAPVGSHIEWQISHFQRIKARNAMASLTRTL